APVAIAVGGADTEAPPDPCAKWLHNQLADSRLYELGPTVGHYAFLCEATEFGRACEPDICRDAPGVGRRVVHDRIARVALDLAGRGEAPGGQVLTIPNSQQERSVWSWSLRCPRVRRDSRFQVLRSR